MQKTLKNTRKIEDKFLVKFSKLRPIFCQIVNFGQTKNVILGKIFFVFLVIMIIIINLLQFYVRLFYGQNITSQMKIDFLLTRSI